MKGSKCKERKFIFSPKKARGGSHRPSAVRPKSGNANWLVGRGQECTMGTHFEQAPDAAWQSCLTYTG